MVIISSDSAIIFFDEPGPGRADPDESARLGDCSPDKESIQNILRRPNDLVQP